MHVTSGIYTLQAGSNEIFAPELLYAVVYRVSVDGFVYEKVNSSPGNKQFEYNSVDGKVIFSFDIISNEDRKVKILYY